MGCLRKQNLKPDQMLLQERTTYLVVSYYRIKIKNLFEDQTEVQLSLFGCSKDSLSSDIRF